jgi:hypothetical protein
MNAMTARTVLPMLLLAALVAGAGAQEAGGFKKSTTAQVPQTALTPVTEAEAAAVFRKLEQAMGTVIKAKPKTETSLKPSPQPVTREQVVREMDRLFEAARPAFRFTPRKIPVQLDRLMVAREAQPAAERLIAWGFVGRTSPMVIGAARPMTVQSFGDELGFFIARLAELTHTPSSKWSPALMRTG